MSNYSKWDKFDPDLVCREIDAQQSIDSSKKAKKKAFTDSATESEQNIANAKKAAEALQSQADVAALKAKGMGGRRRREKSVCPETSNISSQESTPAPPQQKSIAERLGAVTDFLYRLLKQVENIRACTEKKISHMDGFLQAIDCLQNIRTFSHIKNATVMATLSSSFSADCSTVVNASAKIMEDLNDSEDFLINQTVNCLSLFALSCGELALSADCSRYVLKRQGNLADAGIWIMRGLSLAAIGSPFLGKVHFSTAYSSNAEYAGLKACLPVMENASMAYSRQFLKLSKKDVVNKELCRAITNYFTSRSLALKDIPDLAVITKEDVQHFIAEGALWAHDPVAVFHLEQPCSPPVSSNASAKDDKNRNDSTGVSVVHLEDYFNTTQSAIMPSNTTESSVSVDNIISILRELVAHHSTRNHDGANDCRSPLSVLLSKQSSNDRVALKNGNSYLLILVAIQIMRKIFYEAQVLYLESLFQSAEGKYCASILLAQAVRALLLVSPQEDSSSPVVEQSDLEQVDEYVLRVQAACYLNISTCALHHSNTIGKYSNLAKDNTAGQDAETAEIVKNPRSVKELLDGVSGRSISALQWCDRGLAIQDSLAGRYRRILILEKYLRIKEGLRECDRMEEMLVTETDKGMVVAPIAAGLAPSLSQEYFCGFSLPMPLPSMISADDLDIQKSTSGDGREEIDFDELLHRAMTERNIKVKMEQQQVRTDRDIRPDQWRRLVTKKRMRLQYLQRKYGDGGEDHNA